MSTGHLILPKQNDVSIMESFKDSKNWFEVRIGSVSNQKKRQSQVKQLFFTILQLTKN